MKRRICVIFFLFLINAHAGEDELINLAGTFYSNTEYYNAITELMRYQHLYPEGKYYPASMLLLGKAYYKGDNYSLAVDVLSRCFNSYRNLPEGEESLYLLGSIRLLSGAPVFSVKTFQQYRYVYSDGKYRESAAFKLCNAYALSSDLELAMLEINRFKKEFPDGRLQGEAVKLEKFIIDEINRPQKSILVSALGSLALPGFGHFYTGNYKTGALSLLSNALLIFLSYDGYRDRNKTQMYFFGAMEFIFYQYSLAGGINSVYEYNNRENYYKRVRLGIGTDF